MPIGGQTPPFHVCVWMWAWADVGVGAGIAVKSHLTNRTNSASRATWPNQTKSGSELDHYERHNHHHRQHYNTRT